MDLLAKLSHQFILGRVSCHVLSSHHFLHITQESKELLHRTSFVEGNGEIQRFRVGISWSSAQFEGSKLILGVDLLLSAFKRDDWGDVPLVGLGGTDHLGNGNGHEGGHGRQ